MELGAEDRMGILEFVEGVLEKGEVWRVGEEEGDDGDAGATGNGSAEAILGSSDGSAFRVGHCTDKGPLRGKKKKKNYLPF